MLALESTLESFCWILLDFLFVKRYFMVIFSNFLIVLIFFLRCLVSMAIIVCGDVLNFKIENKKAKPELFLQEKE